MTSRMTLLDYIGPYKLDGLEPLGRNAGVAKHTSDGFDAFLGNRGGASTSTKKSTVHFALLKTCRGNLLSSQANSDKLAAAHFGKQFYVKKVVLLHFEARTHPTLLHRASSAEFYLVIRFPRQACVSVAAMASTKLIIRSIAIIGAGPSGIAAAKYLISEKVFTKISVFEQRSNVGGIWNADFTSPEVDVATYPSPIYHGLESNIPSEIMQYHKQPFAPNVPLLPNDSQVLEYLRAYAEDVIPNVHLRLRHQVLDVSPLPTKKWRLKFNDLDADTVHEEIYDAVLIANGRYNKPYEPALPGLDRWKERYPNTVLHSKFYRNERIFRDKLEKTNSAEQKVLIIGFSASGVDVANGIEPFCAKPLLICQNSRDGLSPGSQGFAERRAIFPSIVEFDISDRSVLFSNGKRETGLDYILLCTGYEYEYPFLSGLPGFEGGKGDGNTRTYQHIFHVDHVTLSFMTLPLRVVAFPFAETQAAVVARVWSGRLSLPSYQEMVEWIGKVMYRRGTGKDFHKMGYPADADYINDMHHWCQQAEFETDATSLSPPLWGGRERWLRRTLHNIKRATDERGEERFLVKTVEDAGFFYADDS
ncbi:hypothetical protein O1611_g5507 [Lasiodiplodia mahajangana]|uniref:Uncharacterized protein n=1 Tax=Lasiodiplodia mahajangana TaxID=1108764 RepID=A0ACC2JKZ9_9PEZI|nr:hypothetical protein O1611_g5507 [Lasiodiplodia mahajangana]